MDKEQQGQDTRPKTQDKRHRTQNLGLGFGVWSLVGSPVSIWKLFRRSS